MRSHVTLIPGDGTGPELTEATRRVLEATGVEFDWDVQQAGADVMDQFGGNPLPEPTLDSIRRTGVALKGPITTPVGGGFRSVNVGLRKSLDLYAQVRPCKTYEGVRTRFDDVDLIIVRENTDGLYLRVAREVAEENSDVEFDDRIVDNMCMQLVQRPEEYDVLVLPNLYGDIVSDLAAGMIGGLGMAPGANFGEEVAIFEPTHGSAPKYAGQNRVNPMAMMLSGMLMLRHLEETEAADRLESAISDVIRAGESVTYDMKPSRDDPSAVGTSEVADAIIDKMGARV